MKLPKPLTRGDKVHIVAPAKVIDSSYVDHAIDFLTLAGYEVIQGKHLGESNGQFAGSDDQRLGDLQEAFDSDESGAILCARGGYGTTRILHRLDTKKFARNPKWLLGFSDITALHLLLQFKLEVASVHSTMPLNFGENSEQSLTSLVAALEGMELEYDLHSNPFNRPGITSGMVVGGNLSMIIACLGTECEPQFDQKILFLEEVGEPFYKVDRMIQTLQNGGKLDNLAGLIVGTMTDVKDEGNWFDGSTIEEIILDRFRSSNFPICFHFPAGHHIDNRALYFGREATLVVGDRVNLRY